MKLDPDTLLVLNVVNVLVLATTLPAMMGRKLSPAATAARRSLVVQAGGWIALILSGLWPDTWADLTLSTVSMVCISASHWFMYQALEGWLGPRALRTPLVCLVLAMPLGYALLFGSYPMRVGWSNFLIAGQTVVVAISALWPRPTGVGPWRWVMAAVMMVMAIMTAGRGVMGAFFTDQYPYFAAPHPLNLAALLVANVVLVMVNVGILVAWREEAERQLREQATTDSLTGVPNRHNWNSSAPDIVAHAQRHGLQLALLTLDLDHFKQVNDTHGHQAGDAALKFFGELLRSNKRAGDLIARVGGEEFCVLMPLADARAVEGFDRRLRTELLATAQGKLGFGLNFSAGAAYLGDEDALPSLMKRSDAALYQAKASGRGRLMNEGDVPAQMATGMIAA